jgi:hypothetical protein
MSLCERAAVEKDAEKLMALIAEITALLDAKQKRLDSWKARRKRRASSNPKRSAG